ncbi:MAG: DNA polymerase II large subunit [Candidatus Micrarchaeia archaeon]
MNASPRMEAYFKSLNDGIRGEYSLAERARAKGLDASDIVDVPIAPDVAARVEGLVGPKGVALVIREALKAKGREAVCFELCDRILAGEFGAKPEVELIEQAVRTGLALYTEGVVSAPIEGVSRVLVRQNQDGSKCLAVYFAGPIRGAGGTGQAFPLMLGDYCRQKLGLAEHRPTDDEVERYVEELNLYAIRTRAGQYTPKADEVRLIARSCPVCVEGEPTEDYEVSVHKPREGSSRVRGGTCLVFSEGLCLKAAKLLRMCKAAGLDWGWIEGLVKVKKGDKEQFEIKPNPKYYHDLVGGRPIFGYPMRRGGFRLRYGRTPFCGIQGKGMHTASMEILREFPVMGTQVKTERPGKGCIVTGCDEIDGPIVRLKNGSVRKINSFEEAKRVRADVDEVLFNGDFLVCYGDFLKSNHPLVPSGWCDDWFLRLLESKNITADAAALSWDEAMELSRAHNVPLAPKHTLYWSDLTCEELAELAEWITAKGRLSFNWFQLDSLVLPADEEKRLLGFLGLEHDILDNTITLKGDAAKQLLYPLGLVNGKQLDKKTFDSHRASGKSALETVNACLGVTVKSKSGTYIGASMGRPEKSKERAMKPPVHSLFPVGLLGGATRDLVKATQGLKRRGENYAEFDLTNRVCPSCAAHTWRFQCPACGERTVASTEKPAILQKVDLASAFDAACERVRSRPVQVKAVMGMISEGKTPEALEKGVLRAKHDVTVFRDGTCRYDATEIPATHFKVREAGVGLYKLRELGYEVDCYGKPLESEEQTVELYPQDVLVSEHALDYLHRVSRFIDDLLVYHYGLPAFYNSEKPADMVGKLLIAIAPHTSAGVVVRIVGMTGAQGLVAHPYLHCACRRNADGDELGVLMLLDCLINFSLALLPSTRGGKMDAPLVVMNVLDPREVDDEVHAMDRCWRYPLELYEAGERLAPPSQVKLELVADKLGSAEQYEGLGFTHAGTLEGPCRTRYVQLGDMQEKLDEELDLMSSLRAVDAADAAEHVILSHFFPDLYGNLRAFSRQQFRCVGCTSKYRRVPLSGKCTRCGGKLILTVSKGSVEKYLELSRNLAEKYALPNYLKQRLMLIKKEIASIFDNEKSKQFSLSDYA